MFSEFSRKKISIALMFTGFVMIFQEHSIHKYHAKDILNGYIIGSVIMIIGGFIFYYESKKK